MVPSTALLENARAISQPRSPQPFVKWAGGKSQLISQISRLLPSFSGRYFEPFLGGGAVFFHVRPSSALVSDANRELIIVYRTIQNDLLRLESELDKIQDQSISRKLFNHYRGMNPEDLTPAQRAARFIFLNKTCFNGLYRVNRLGKFNVPFGQYKRMPRLYDPLNFIQVHSLLQKVTLMSATYEVALQDTTEGDFVYLDPPYAREDDAQNFVSYTNESFSAADQRRLAAKFLALDRRGCLVMLSNSDIPLVRELYSRYANTTVRVRADRMINCIGSDRTGFNELMIMNYEPPSRTLHSWMNRQS